MFAFDLHDVSAGYGSNVALHSISCRLRTRRTTALIGPGGSGKSTLLKLLGGPYGASSPGLWHTGHLLLTEEPIAVLPQSTRRREVRLARLLSLRSPIDQDPKHQLAEFWQYVAEDAAGLLERNLDASLDALSPSLRRLAEFTLLASGPESTLLIDEPDQGSDTRIMEWILAKLAGLRGEKTIVLVSHNLQIVRRTSHDSIFLLDGRIIESGNTERLFTAPRRQRTHDFVTLGS